ncbi:hypothetical protein [Sulfurimonas sp.]|uniref:hypothetical protein n=1 Tax=Sulfurimonas sp. TaxID=2022749 RepID=UPI003D0E8EF7
MQEKLESISDKEFFFLGLVYAASVVSLFLQLPLLSIFFAGAVFWYCYIKIKKFDSMKNWVKCDAKLIKWNTLKKIYNYSPESYIYVPDCLYTYTYNSQKYIGQNISFYPRDSMTQDLFESYQFTQNIKYTINKGIYVNPDNPEESVVFRDMAFKSAPIYKGGVVLAIITIIISIIQVVIKVI